MIGSGESNMPIPFGIADRRYFRFIQLCNWIYKKENSELKKLMSESKILGKKASKSDKKGYKRYWAVFYKGKIDIFKDLEMKILKTSYEVTDLLEIHRIGLYGIVLVNIEIN